MREMRLSGLEAGDVHLGVVLDVGVGVVLLYVGVRVRVRVRRV